ncbi:unnamed protein product [Miscanthus lutarioriparius]|uniref:Uncharacterized protein n=1 Tax=Miscanthus lutarioriparius TaxID=422564 RepID=A0A811Q420_9POAL|nr:unnamed protein product [Miscanthus lutarioriparius]
MDDDDDFTFPTVAAAARGPPTAPQRQLGLDEDTAVPPHLLQLPDALPNLAAGASPLWPFAGSVPKTTTTTALPSSPTVTADDEQERSAVAEEESHPVAADEDRMDLLWEGTPTTTTRSIATAPEPEPRSVAGHAGPPPPPKQRAAAAADAERMDKLWESFNEDLVLRHRDRARRSKSAAGINIKVSRAAAGGPDDPADDDDRWYLCNYDSPSSGADDDESSDQETSASSPAEQRRGYGCAPTMLRASSRAGGAGQFCAGSSPRARRRRRGRGAAAGWALLLRLFRRLFAVDKTAPSSSSHSHSSLYVP